jgi:mannose-6-phosphate isomerase-like protein (cupin superfamily)
MSSIHLIKSDKAKVVNLGTKVITKYTSSDKQLEINHMLIEGSHPETSNHFIYETKVRFMVYILKGTGLFVCDDERYLLSPGDVLDIPVKTKFRVEAEESLEYLAFENPAWYPEQAFIVDNLGNVIEETKE